MSLSCECRDEGSDYYYYPAADYSILKTKKRKRCESCNKLIDIGSIVTLHFCYREPENEIEEKTHGYEVPMDSKYHCESCADIEFNLIELGFCINLGENMKELLSDYVENYSTKK